MKTVHRWRTPGVVKGSNYDLQMYGGKFDLYRDNELLTLSDIEEDLCELILVLKDELVSLNRDTAEMSEW